MTKIEACIEYSIKTDVPTACVMAAELVFAGNRFYAETVVWKDDASWLKPGTIITVDLLLKARHCLENMLLVGLHAWIEDVAERSDDAELDLGKHV
jgi:hypothetical protein